MPFIIFARLHILSLMKLPKGVFWLFQSLLRAKQQFVAETNTDKNFEMFVKSFQEFEKNMVAMEEKPERKKLYGRPYRSI
jgi:hypothetical protein